MGRVLVIVMAASAPLGGSGRPATSERFCGLPLLERAQALVARAVADATVVTSDRAEGLVELVAAHAAEAAAHDVVLAIDPRVPLIAEGTLARLVAAAGAGRAVAVGRSFAQPAALAIPTERLDAAAEAVLLDAPDREVAPVTDKTALVELERAAYLARNQELLAAGLLVRDPAT